jgi:hypothetical protein
LTDEPATVTENLPEGWSDFFVANAGVAGALAGLIIVAISVNVGTIIKIPGMTSRAGATVASLMLIVVSAAAALIPGQGPRWLGGEIMLFTAAALIVTVNAAVRMIRAAVPPYVVGSWIKSFLSLLAIVPFGVGGFLLLSGSDQGLYWLAAGFLLVFAGSVANAWVLLIEILR